MKAVYRNPRQQGIALILSLLLMFVLVVLAVAGFSNTHIQERSAGNARLQTMAFEAASAGANNAINFFDANHDLGPDELCGSTGHTGWDDPTAWVDMGTVGGASLQQRMYCLADAYPCSAEEEDEGLCTSEDRPARSQLFVLSRGEVTVDEKVVAQRDIEVRLEVGSSGAAGDGCASLCLPACDTGTLNFPNSNSFRIDGNGGPAITAGCQEAADDILDAIRSQRIGNYYGGIAAAEPGSPWDSPTATEQFRLNLLAAAQAGPCQSTCYFPSGLTANGNSTFGTTAQPQVTYVQGNANMSGVVNGAGILVVNGNLYWSGTNNFQGLILVLGGTFEISGGGNGGNPAGSVVVLNHLGAVGDVFGPANFSNTGGGNAIYKFSCTALMAAQGLLNDEGQDMWSPECDVAPQNPYEAGPDEIIIASWRENVGWRELDD